MGGSKHPNRVKEKANQNDIHLFAALLAMTMLFAPACASAASARLVEGAGVSYHNSITAAFDAISSNDGTQVQAQAGTFREDLLLNAGVPVTLTGGLDSSYSQQVGSTLVEGALTIASGSLETANIVLTSEEVPSSINYFSWDCEEPHPYLTGDFFPNTSISTTESHSGTKSMQINVRGDDGGNQNAGARIGTEIRLGPVTQGKWYYYRWWMKLDSSFRWGAGTGYAKAFRVKRTDEQRPGVWTGYIGKQGFFMHEMHGAGESGTEDGPNWWDANGPHIQYDLQSDAGTGWHEYIVAIKTQSGVMVSDGVLQAYRDGVFLGERTGQHFLGHDADCTEAWNGAMLQPYFQLNGTASDGGLMWIDDYSMDNTWNSLVYPPIPKNLRVRVVKK